MYPENLPFRVIRVNSQDEVIARANKLIVGGAACEPAISIGRTQSSTGMVRTSLRGASRNRKGDGSRIEPAAGSTPRCSPARP